MKRSFVTLLAAASICPALLTAGSAAAATPAGATRAGAGPAANGHWGTAEQMPGIAALNTGDYAVVNAISCASPGNCSAVGRYNVSSSTVDQQAFVASQAHGVWGKAEEVPGTPALNKGGFANVFSVSCPSAGNCAAGGFYAGRAGYEQALVVSEVNGVWGRAEKVPGTAALNTGRQANVYSVSCASPGNCSAGGEYRDSSLNYQAFVVSETNGVWGKAEEVPGTAAMNEGLLAAVNSISCTSPGNCSAGGAYSYRPGRAYNMQAFVADEVNGVWGKAEEVPGTAALNTLGTGSVNAVSCTSPGNCAAGGDYGNSARHEEAFVAGQTDGVWGKAHEVHGLQALNTGGAATFDTLSCGAPGDCSAGGQYTTSSRTSQAWAVTETNGVWGSAEQVPGTATLNAGGGAAIDSVSCAGPGDCSAGGGYLDASQHSQAFTVGETNGVWDTAREVPGTAALNAGGSAAVEAVSCAEVNRCSAGGFYMTGSNDQVLFVAGER